MTWQVQIRFHFPQSKGQVKSAKCYLEGLKALNRCGTLEENNKMNVAAVVTLLSFCATLALPGKCILYFVCALGAWGLGKEPSWVSFLSWWEVLIFLCFFSSIFVPVPVDKSDQGRVERTVSYACLIVKINNITLWLTLLVDNLGWTARTGT